MTTSIDILVDLFHAGHAAMLRKALDDAQAAGVTVYVSLREVALAHYYAWRRA